MRCKKHIHTLQALCKLAPEHRRAVLKVADSKLVRVICECALNLLHGGVPLTSEEKKHLAKHKKILRKLACNKGTWNGKKKLLVQKGSGFLPLLLGPLLSILASKVFGVNN